MDVAIGFQLQSCSSCHLYTAVTDSGGDYSTSIPAGTYLVACKTTDGNCTANTSDGSTVVISGDTRIDLAVSSDSTDEPSLTPTSSAPAPRPATPSSTSDEDAPILSGYVRNTSGQPVAGVEIEIEFVVEGNVHIATDDDGYYSIPADYVTVPGIAHCIPVADGYNDCEPSGGIQDPVQIDPSHGPQVINWVATAP